jgi:glycosyltransferase involved in cell wall biosynthesis
MAWLIPSMRLGASLIIKKKQRRPLTKEGRLDARGRVITATMFFPRGGSAHTVRDVAQELPRHGWDVTIVSGSRSDLGPDADARSFYRGLDVRPVDYAPAVRNADELSDDQAPMHPSYEDRPGAPDPVFASVDDTAFERHVRAWCRALHDAAAMEADLLCLHHLTPMNEAVARAAPDVPVVGHLHGTELLMLERIASGAPSWTYAERWADRMQRWAAECRRLLVAPGGRERAAQVLELPRDRFVPVPNGFDPDRFRPRPIDRLVHWRRQLVERPRGALRGGEAGSLAYSEADLRSFADGVVLTYVGRFTEVKRVPLLLRAHALAQPHFRRPAPLVLIGGYPGEHEGPHPAEVIAETGARDVFLAGWRDHDALPEFLAASDAIVLSSVREQFGMVLVEGMACGLPAVAASSIGARSIVDDGRTGWLVPPDDAEALAEALICVVNEDGERQRRGREARAAVVERFSMPRVVERIAAVFDEESGRRDPAADRVEEPAERGL